MRAIRGDFTLMSLPDVMQWAETNRKTGTLQIEHMGVLKMFYFQEGKIIFVSSQKEGERIGEFFVRIGSIGPERLKDLMKESRRLGIPFTGYLISEKIIKRKVLEEGISQLVKTALVDALAWDTGTFEFTDELPAVVRNGPVQLNTSFLVFDSVKLLDESRKAYPSHDIDGFERQIANLISAGNIELPVIPDIMSRLCRYIEEDASVHEIGRLIMSDQILTSKILRVANSGFYNPPYKITFLQQAIIFMGFKAILSIVMVHTLSVTGAKDMKEIKEILHHSFLCAFLAKRIALAVGIDPEEAFVCGLLHDIGKTVLLNHIGDSRLPRDAAMMLIEEHHPQVGALIATKWNLSEVIREAVRYHHNPGEAKANRKVVETVCLANILAKDPLAENLPYELFEHIDIGQIEFKKITGELEGISREASLML
jgi:putative nucleotidyltransferase with HDIG domain